MSRASGKARPRGGVARPCLLSITAALLLALPREAAGQQLTRGPFLQSLATDSVVIVWRTDVAADSIVEFGLTEDCDQMVILDALTQEHAVKIGGLEPGTTYHFRARSGGVLLGEPSTFRTANPEEDTLFNFGVFGDCGDGNEIQDQETALLDARGIRFFLVTGDVVYPSGEAANYDPHFFLPYEPLLRKMPVWPVLGNHDMATDDGQPFLDAFHLPANNAEHSERYYSFDYGNAHFIGLDGDSPFEPGSPQYLWLVSELKYHRKRWNFAFIHYTPYSSSRYGPETSGYAVRDSLSPIFEVWGLDALFSGHKHHYERFHPIWQEAIDLDKGVTYVVTGGGGAEISDVYGSDLTAYFEKAFHVTHITVDGDSLHGEAVRNDGVVIDTFSMTARAWDGPLVSVAPEDLLLHLDFDECEGDAVADASIYAQHGYLGSTAGADAADPQWDSANAFDGCGSLAFFPTTSSPKYVTIPNSAGLFDPDDGFTFTAWVKYRTLGEWRTVLSAGNYRFALYLSAGGAAQGYFNSLNPTATGVTPEGIPAGKWSHVALVFDAGEATLYLDGIPLRTTFHTGVLTGQVASLRIGWDGYAGDAFDGWIDEVKVYRRPLEAQEVRAEMVSTLEEIEYPPADPSVPPHEPLGPDDLVCRLAFDEPDGQQVLDASSRGNHGWLGAGSGNEASDPIRNPYAKWGAGALDFDGADDLVSVADLLGDFDFDEEFTAMAWVRYDDDAPWRPVLAGGDYEYALYLDTAGAARAYFRNLVPTRTGLTVTTLSPGAWHHVALVKEPDLVTLYLDGQLARTTSVTGGSLAPVALFRVGHDGYPGDYFRGSVDEVKVYRRALIPSEIRSEMDSLFGAPYPDPIEPPPPGPAQHRIAHFRFEEGTGQTVADSSGHGRSGYLGDSAIADGRDPEWVVGGGIGGSHALAFDGLDRVVTIPDNDGAFDLDASFTMMAWIRYDEASDWSAILSGGTYRYALYLSPDGRLRAYLRDLGPKSTPLGSATIPPGVWTHVALTKEGTTVRLFVDGVQVGSSTHTGSIQPVDRFRIGFDGYPEDGFRGRIDDVRVHDRALTAEEILAERNDGT